MADFDYEKLADLIVDRLMKKQEEYEHAAMVMRKLQNLKARLIKKGIIDK